MASAASSAVGGGRRARERPGAEPREALTEAPEGAAECAVGPRRAPLRRGESLDVPAGSPGGGSLGEPGR